MMGLACTTASDSAAPVEPSLVLLRPADGDVVCGTPLVIETEVEGFDLVEENYQEATPGVGHVHVYLNGAEVLESGDEIMEVPDVLDRDYQLTVELGLANHAKVEPYVGTTVYITVDNQVCGG
jgi:hypothetical protein